MTECVHVIVKGRVQGVYFRAFTQKEAVKLNLVGFVRNLPDGDVEIVACGEEAALRQLVAWCHKGPLLARVTSVMVKPIDCRQHFEGFTIQ